MRDQGGLPMAALVLKFTPGAWRVRQPAATVEVEMPGRRDPQRVAVRGLLRRLARHDPDTARHCLRVRRYVLEVARLLGLTGQQRRLLSWAAALHDVGKLGVPRDLLRKPGPLSAGEYGRVRQHPALGEHLLAPVLRHPLVLRSVRHHHERYDGAGYPDGLAGRQIPWPARLVALADCFDALTQPRPYRAAGNRAEALAFLRAEAGRRFDPALTALFVRALTPEEQRC
jgi:HD-GYP domain-containing protein (c-di-GMP phosphodiesterase class II)